MVRAEAAPAALEPALAPAELAAEEREEAADDTLLPPEAAAAQYCD